MVFKSKMKISLDIDGVMANMASVMITIYNYMSVCKNEFPFNRNKFIEIKDLVDYDTTKIMGRDAFFEMAKIMEANNACLRIPLYKDALSVYYKLKELGDVTLVTKPFSLYKNWCDDRMEWIKRNFGEDQKVIFTSKKYLVDSDILIDDCIDIIEDWLKYTDKPVIKVERPWNKNYNKDYANRRIFNAGDITHISKIVESFIEVQ
jgi:5'(3')-deoxyribonucleotidase